VPCWRHEWEGKTLELADLLADVAYLREGGELARKGLYLDLPAYGCNIFRVSAAGSGGRRRPPSP
jgi:hypothetical protein